jgi:hypothetical protein
MGSRGRLAGLAVVCALLVSAPVGADRRDRGDRERGDRRDRDDNWVSYDDEGGCLGGAKCGENGWQLRIRLEDSPVTGVRFYTHDNVGDHSRGHLRVKIDGDVIDDDIDVPKDGDTYEYDVDRVQGRYLIFEAFAHDEVVVEDIEVQYGRRHRR